jgi:argininosuccinate synthase
MRIVLAFSGGLDTSVILKLVRERLDAEVIAVTVDVGQGDDATELKEKAGKLGAKKFFWVDCREEFATEYVGKSILANGLYEREYPLSTALARPLIAKKLVEIAEKEGADAIAHGCTGKGNDQVRFDLAVEALSDLKIIAPVREWGLTRSWEMEYAKKNGIPVNRKVYSIDANMWGRSIEGGELEDPSFEPTEDVFLWSRVKKDEDETVELKFYRGLPVALNGESMELSALIEALNVVAGGHGIGRIDHIEDRVVGIKSREVYECPAASVIAKAHFALEKLTMTKWMLDFKASAEQKWGWLVFNGLWFEPLREALDEFMKKANERVSGSVRLRLSKKSLSLAGMISDESLYSMEMSTFEKSSFDQGLAKGFIDLFGLQSVMAEKKNV